MTTLSDKYRPRTLDEVLGQPKAVSAIRSRLSQGGFGGAAVWISGPTGVGKSTLAKIIGESVGGAHGVTEYEEFGEREYADLRDTLGMYSMTGGRCYIINEAHGVRAQMIRKLCTLLDNPLPANACLIFTTTTDGEKLFEDRIDGQPLMDRCAFDYALTAQGLTKAASARFLEIAQAEGLAGDAGERDVVNLFKELGNSLRRVLSAIGKGALLGKACAA